MTKQTKTYKAWALCHRGTPLVIYTQWTRQQVAGEVRVPDHSVARAEVKLIPRKAKR